MTGSFFSYNSIYNCHEVLTMVMWQCLNLLKAVNKIVYFNLFYKL